MLSPVKIIFIFFFFLSCVVHLGHCAEKTVTYSCNEDASNSNLVKLNIRIIPHQDPIFRVYGFNAASGDTSLSANRIDDCVRNTSGISNVDTDAIVFDLSFDITGSSFECGATVTDLTGVTGVKLVTVVLRVFAYSETMLSGDDDVYVTSCRSDDLNSAVLSSGALDQTTVSLPSVVVLPTKFGTYLRIRDAITDAPVTVGSLTQLVYMSVEFYPEIQIGPDSYGTTFYIGFLGNDVISGTSASSLTIVVIPRYTGRTDVSVTTSSGTQQQNVTDGSPMTFTLPTDLQGCSDGGVAEIEYKGVKVHSYDKEVAVVVYNRESDSEDMYTALPLDVLGTKYLTVSMPTRNDSSELMIIGTENTTNVKLTIPAGTTTSVTVNGTTKSAGEAVSFSLNERQTFHLAVASSSISESVTGFLVESDKPVSVISGNRKVNDDHTVDQVPPVTQLGNHYILTPADPTTDLRNTTYIVQAVEAGDTIVTRYVTSSSHENYTLTQTTNSVKEITVAYNEPCEIISTQPVQVTQVVNPPNTGQTDFEPALLIMPPVYRFSNKYTHYHKDYLSKFSIVLPSSEAALTIAGGPVTLANQMAVIGPNGFQFSGRDISLPGGTAFVLSTSTSTNRLDQFLPIAYPAKTGSPVNSGSAFIPPGLQHPTKGSCYSVGHNGDNLDNDCDGKFDEEIKDGLDNDGDGRFDEDNILPGVAGALAVRPFSCEVSGVADFSVSAKLIPLTKADGCKEARSAGPFAVSEDFQNVVTSTIGTGSQPKQLRSGNFTLGKFVDSPKLYFRCQSSLCYSDSDTDCTVICGSTTRKKRQDEAPPENITTDIWIYPYTTGNQSPNSNTEKIVVPVTAQACLENTTMQVMLALLSALFLMAFTTALCFCCLFRRRWNESKGRNRITTYDGSTTTSHTSKRKHPYPTRYRF